MYYVVIYHVSYVVWELIFNEDRWWHKQDWHNINSYKIYAKEYNDYFNTDASSPLEIPSSLPSISICLSAAFEFYFGVEQEIDHYWILEEIDDYW